MREVVSQLPIFSEEHEIPEQSPPAPAPPVQKIYTYVFDLDVVFQTMYELCTNETVKDHIKLMRADRNTAFDNPAILKSLSDLASTVTVEDNFYNFPIPAVLKILFQTTKSEKHKQVLKKMNQTAGTIFLDGNLPLEGQVKEQIMTAAVSSPESAPPKPRIQAKPGLPTENIDSMLSLIDETVNMLEEEKNGWLM
ncbi:MAG: hypothetical protein HQK55_19455 [Deltaproteobacteria bacterium]|nr:hypothetical protein [Deltaproteobacteria bacterium]